MLPYSKNVEWLSYQQTQVFRQRSLCSLRDICFWNMCINVQIVSQKEQNSKNHTFFLRYEGNARCATSIWSLRRIPQNYCCYIRKELAISVTIVIMKKYLLPTNSGAIGKYWWRRWMSLRKNKSNCIKSRIAKYCRCQIWVFSTATGLWSDL